MGLRWWLTTGVSVCLLALAAAVVAAACGSGDDDDDKAAGGGGSELTVVIANYELLAGTDNRVIVGLLNGAGNQFVSYGNVAARFFHLGDRSGQGDPRFFQEATAQFRPVPGEGSPNPPAKPRMGPASQGRGVYAADRIAFDKPGFWRIDITADIEGIGAQSASAKFEVLPAPRVPAPGQPAPATDTLTTSSDAPRAAIDSRAAVEAGRIPDESLHSLSIAEALKQGKPILVVFSTPVYCVSQFCGPVTEMVEGLAKEYGDRAIFIHVEIWRDFQARQVNRGAADWVYRDNALQEPWFFLIGRDGVIRNRWDNLATREEIVPALEQALRP